MLSTDLLDEDGVLEEGLGSGKDGDGAGPLAALKIDGHPARVPAPLLAQQVIPVTRRLAKRVQQVAPLAWGQPEVERAPNQA